MSTLIWRLDPKGVNIPAWGSTAAEAVKVLEHFPSYDIHRQTATFHRGSVTNIYKTKDNKFFHLHGTCSSSPKTNDYII